MFPAVSHPHHKRATATSNFYWLSVNEGSFFLKFILVPEDVNSSIKEVVAIVSQITVFNLIQV